MRHPIYTEEWLAEYMGKVRGGVHAERSGLAGLRPPAPSPYKSKLEASYAAHLELLKKAGEIKEWKYEPYSMKLAEGKRYRPDFIIVFPLGMERKPEAHEVKGKWTKNKRDGLTHLKWAAQLYSDIFTFKLIQWEGHGFTTQEIGG